ncbi:YHS domain-containing (seleno)protein [Roseibaca sp. Y0-43]|uniref:YHS domain-containing (seleno)protein n=1 Tax=Roseibaca sp. Y0-43 TaxID=2816854 RepID=UPI001D0C9A56|nr:YHS domain-containing (seleno)protein [Roseibaca sp. Y0-43]MCC1481357.1 YHS domain-containing protein [Roseibaca sp. Y0-43]
MISRRALLVATLLALPATPLLAQAAPALDGYDPVAYFTEGAPRRGDASYSLDWNGQRWHFASAANRDAFAADPAAYAPQYGGNCAWAVAEGYLAPVDPEAWVIVDGKLYLNANRRIQRRWERDIPGFIARADANWPGLRNN